MLESPAVRYAVAGFCGYEVVAIMSFGKIPTLTNLDSRCHVLGPIILGGLVAHFYGQYLSRCYPVHMSSFQVRPRPPL